MKLRFVLSMSMVAAAFLLVAGCGDNVSVVKQTTEFKTDKVETINLSVVETVGNNSYIPLSLDSSAYKNRGLILNVMKKFEDEKPNLEVVSYEIDKQQDAAYVSHNYVFGIWVHHRPRQK